MIESETMKACDELLNKLEEWGFPRSEMPGYGDIHEALKELGYKIVKDEGDAA